MTQSQSLSRNTRDLYFAASHQAAQVVAALMLGCAIGDIEIGRPPDSETWGFRDAPAGDVETVCAAGYATEVSMGRIAEKAWPHAYNDLLLLAHLHAERTGVQLDSSAVEERFLAGASNSRALLDHPTGAEAVDRLATALGESYAKGNQGMSVAEIREVLSGLL